MESIPPPPLRSELPSQHMASSPATCLLFWTFFPWGKQLLKTVHQIQ